MRSLPAAVTAGTQRQTAQPVYLLKWTLTHPTLPTLTLRYSDDTRTLLGEQWEPAVIEWGAIAAAMNATDTSGTPTSTEVVLSNLRPAGSKSRLSALMRRRLNTSGTYEYAFSEVTIYQVFRDVAEADATIDPYTEARLYVQDVSFPTSERLVLSLIDITQSLEDRSLLPTVTRDLYPSCSSADVGKKIPALFNNPKGIKTRCLVGGGFGRLVAPLTATAMDGSTFEMEDGEETFPTGTFRVQIEGEAMTILRRSGTTFTLGGRGRANTLAVTHDAGSAVYEMRDGAQAYRYAVGCNPGGAQGLKNQGVDGPVGPLSGVSNVKSDHGTLTGVTVSHDEEFPAGSGIRLTILNVPGVPKMPTQKPVAADAGTERFTRTIQHLNGELGMRVNGIGSAPVGITKPASMPPLSGTEDSKNVNWEVTYSVEAFGAGTSWSFQHSTPSIVDQGFGPLIAGGPWAEIGRHLGTRTATFGTGPSYGSLAFRTEFHGSTTARLTVTIFSVKAVVEGTRRRTSSEQGKAPAPIGESTADVLFGGITCDAVGLAEDGAGSISGRAGRPLLRPADIVKAIVLFVYPGSTRADFGESFGVTRELQIAAGYEWTMALEETRFAELRRKFGEQGQAALTNVGGKWEYTWLSATPVAVATLDCEFDVMRDSIKHSLTPRAEIKNSLRVLSQPDFRLTGGEQFRRIVVREDLTQPGLTSAMQEDLVLDWVQKKAMANRLGDFWLGWKKSQRTRVDLSGWWNLLAYDPYDVLALDGDDVLADWGGTSLLFRVVERKALLGDDNPGRIALGLVECNHS